MTALNITFCANNQAFFVPCYDVALTKSKQTGMSGIVALSGTQWVQPAGVRNMT
jgi:hypothetical protein